jgi:hypothetical protein
MANDHFISRFLTRRWEVQPGRMLHYFDFATSRFGAEPSARLFADDGLHSTQTGDRLNRLIEQPVAQHLRVLETNPRAAIHDSGSWPVFRALASLWWIQSLRISEAKTPERFAVTLDRFLDQGEALVDTIGTLARDKFHLLMVRTPPREHLFFTEVASFPIPFAGAVALALPLSPQHFLTLVPRDVHAVETHLRSVMNAPLMLSALSLGVGSAVDKVVLPPVMIPTNDVETSGVRGLLLTWRGLARQLTNLFGEASAIAGLPSWRVT